MDELAWKDAGELAGLIRARKLSSLELLELYLGRIERENPALNAVVTLDPERARARARQLDRELERSDARLGPLHGLPITVKDAYETQAVRTTGGVARYRDHVPARNADAVQRLLDAGAVILGKTNVPAFSSDVQSYNELFGTTINPHDPSRTPGGSSGGAAVAVACGFTAFEIGSDIGGSIRTPANWTGVFGHKSSYGLVSMRGHVPFAPGSLAVPDLAVAGPLARSAADLELLLSVLAGPEGEAKKAVHVSLPAPRHARLRDFRVAAWLDDSAFPVDAEVKAVLQRALDALRAAGANIDEEARPDLTLSEVYDNYLSLLAPIMLAELPPAALESLGRLAAEPRGDGPEDPVASYARRGLARHAEWLRQHERRLRYRARLASFFERFDLLLCPVTPVPAIAHDHSGNTLTRQIRVNGQPRPYMDLMSWISLATAAYLPASVAPAGRTRGGLPVGLQIVGPYLEDRMTIAFAGHAAEVLGGFLPPAGFDRVK